MNEFLSKARSKLPRKKRYYVGAVLLILIIILSLGNSKEDETNMLETVTRGDLVRTILATGQVKSDIEVELSLTTGGIANTVPVRVGDQVVRGQTLLSLDAGSLVAERARAYADVLLKRAEMKNKEINLGNVLNQQNTLVENARSKMLSEGLVVEPSSTSYTVDAPVVTGFYTGEEGVYKIIIEKNQSGNDYEIRTFDLENTIVDIDEVSPTKLGTKGLFLSFPEALSQYSNTIWYVTIPNTKSASYGSNFSAYQDALRLRDKAIADADADINNRTNDGSIASAELAKAEAELARANAELAKYTLRAPYDGTITRVDVKIGERVSAYEPIIVLEDLGTLFIEADVNESNATNILPGQAVTVTYDAFGKQDIRNAEVSFIDPSATIVDGIVNYKIRVLIDDTAEIKPGMTANLSIVTGSKEDVLLVPSRVILERDGEKFVSRIIDARKKKTELQMITTGLRGDGNLVEVMSGLVEGEHVRAPEIE